MKVLIDNNVVLDAIVSRVPWSEAAERIVLLIGDGELDGYITANSATDIFYVLKKMTNAATAKDTMRRVLTVFNVLSVSGEDCERALNCPTDDFEDALITVCAENIAADYIVSRDTDFLKAQAPVTVINPIDFLEKLG